MFRYIFSNYMFLLPLRILIHAHNYDSMYLLFSNAYTKVFVFYVILSFMYLVTLTCIIYWCFHCFLVFISEDDQCYDRNVRLKRKINNKSLVYHENDKSYITGPPIYLQDKVSTWHTIQKMLSECSPKSPHSLPH